MFRVYCYASLCLILGACAFPPRQDDVTNLPLVDIVHKVRCEARDAIIEHDTRVVDAGTKKELAEDLQYAYRRDPLYFQGARKGLQKCKSGRETKA